MREYLDRSADGIGAGKRAFRSVHHFHLFHVVQSEVRQIDGAARLVRRHPVDQHLGEIGVPAVEKNGDYAARRPGLPHAESGHRLQQWRELRIACRLSISSRVTMFDRFACRRRFNGLRGGTHHYICGQGFDFQLSAFQLASFAARAPPPPARSA